MAIVRPDQGSSGGGGGGAPSGPAGGDLAGTYPNPTVKAITETSGPTDLVIGTITDGQILKRVGATLVSAAAGAGTVTSVTAADTSVVVAGTAADPTVRTSTLDVVAAQHPPAANWSNNAKKITSLAAATAATDAASLANTLDQFGAPAANVAFNAKKITGLADGAAAQDAAAFGQLTRLLGRTTYAPASQTIKAVASTTLTAFDTTNLTVAFTAPLSGAVLVRFTGMCVDSLTGVNSANLGLFAHGTSNVVGTIAINSIPGETFGYQTPLTVAWLITGLTPGAALQYDLMGAIDANALHIFCYGPTTYDGTNLGMPATLEVWSA